MKKRLLSILLALCMVVSLFTVTAFAAEPVAEINGTPYSTLQAAIDAVNVGETIQLLQDSDVSSLSNVTIDLASGVDLTVNGGTLTDVIIQGDGKTIFGGTVNFYGDNQVISTGLGGSPFDLIVNKGATLLITRFVLGYDRNITVYGEIEDAHTFNPAGKTPSLKFNSTSGVSVGGSGTGNLTVEDAYIELGSSSWKNAAGTYDWNFTNAYVSATSFTNNNARGSDSAHWDVTFDDSVLAAKNYIKNGVGTTYSFTNGSIAQTGSLRIDGVLNIDATSSVTTTAQQNNKVGALDEHGGINGTVNVSGSLTIGSTSKTQLEMLGGTLNVTSGGDVNLGSNTLTVDSTSTLASAGDITGDITVDADADVEITGGKYTEEDIEDLVTPGYVIDATGEVKEDTTQEYVASVGAARYTTLQAAVDKADGKTVTLLKDINATVLPTADSTNNPNNCLIRVDSGKKLTLDLNGHTISVKGDDEAKYDTLAIRNHGDLTIEDNSTAKTGKITLSFDGTNEVGSSQIHSTILNFGTLVIKSGTIENKSTTGYGRYTINNYSWGGNANVTINGGHISNDTTVAVYADGYSDSGAYSCNVTVTGGTIDGGLWYNGRTTTAGKNIAISGGTFIEGNNGALTIRNTPNSAVVSGGEFNGAVDITSGVNPITGGIFSQDPSAYCAEGYTGLKSKNGLYGIVEAAEEEISGKATVTISVLPADADVVVKQGDTVIGDYAGAYELLGGTYTYTVSAHGYISETGSFTVAGENLTINIRLTFIPNVLAVIDGAAGSAEALFSDVDANAWYYDAVQYVLDNGLMNGVGEDTFAPNGTMTRAMVWTVLGRMAGQDFDGTGANWYVEAQNWAIVNGISDGTNPNGAITREELVTMLWRFVDAPVAAENALQWYGDEASVADWAADAMNWAVNRQIIEGANWNLNPQATALRCQVAAILMRYCG